MEEAKQALRDLHSQGFDFNQIVNTGLNPNVLRKLYTNVGIPVTASSNLMQQKIMKPRAVARDVPIESVPGAATVGIHDQHTKSQQRDSNSDVLGNDTLPHLVTEERKINSQPPVPVAKNEGKSVQIQASVTKFSGLNPLGKASGSKAGETKIIDRKEYIARMLAAKAGKHAVSATSSVPVKTSPVGNSGASAQVRSSDAAAAMIPATNQQASDELVDTTSGTQKEDSDVEAKRKAQTDLARQKIEALKLRESIQQQARPETISDAMRHSQQPPAKGVPNIPTEGSIPIPRPLPSRQSSYFSPASRKPPFSIPGLFMTSDAPEPVNPSRALANEGFTVSPHKISYATSDSSKQGLHTHATVSAQSPTRDNISHLPDASVDLNSLPAIIATTTSSNRKRQKASDFIDPPSTRVKRPLGQQEDTSVIIDISDDEVSHNTSGDDSLDIDIVGRRDSLSKKPQVVALGNGKEKSIKSLPPLIDVPPRKKPVAMTPPAAHASGQTGEVKGLKSKEMEIEAMNRKIAELEQRIAFKVKRTASRTHSPGTSSRVTMSPPPGEASHQINDAPNVPLSVSESRNGDVEHIGNRESFIALVEGTESAAAEQLNAEQQLEEVEIAKAEAERSLAAEISRASATDPLTREERMQTPQAEEQSNLQKGEQRFKDEEQKRIHAEEQRHLKVSQIQRAHEEENKKSRQQQVHLHLQEQEQRQAQEALHERLQEHELKRSVNDQRQARKSEIESGLPLLDAEVERTRKRLESLRQEIAGLETELQKGVEGRQGLIEELNNLSPIREALPGPMELDSYDLGNVPKQSTSKQETPGKSAYLSMLSVCSR